MDIVFTDTLTTGNAVGDRLVYYNREYLLSTLRQAAHCASQAGHAVLASFTQSVPFRNPQSIFLAFHHMQSGERFFWEQPTEQKAFVGVGTALAIETTGPASIATAASACARLQQDAVVCYAGGEPVESVYRPVLFGGFAFDPLCSRTALWEGFPDGLLILPRLLFQTSGDNAALTSNTMVQQADDIEYIADEIIASLRRLNAVLEELSFQPAEKETAESVQFSTRELLPASDWTDLVAQTVTKIRRGDFEKVVLARAIEISSEAGSFSVDATLSWLRQNYPGAYKFAIQRGDRYFVSATPEPLLRAQGGQLQTMALAGSAPRGTNEEEDTRLGEELLQSEKNRREHQIVVTTIHETLSRICSEVWVADTPQLLRLKNILHLKTPIVGELHPNRSVLEAVQELHPTPGVGGFPRAAAVAEIRAHEQLDRGWFAGPVGWLDMEGNGEFAVALRSALVDHDKATLFAGCGIVADSQPESEYEETCLKLNVMLRGLSGGDEE